MRKLLFLSVVIIITACNPFQARQGGMAIDEAYSFATPKGFAVAAVFMTINNNTDVDDRMIGFRTNRSNKPELHTMVMEGDIMRMRAIDSYDIPSGKSHMLVPGGDHLMLFDMPENLVAGETFDGIAIFEKSGEVPITINVKSRDEMKNYLH